MNLITKSLIGIGVVWGAYTLAPITYDVNLAEIETHNQHQIDEIISKLRWADFTDTVKIHLNTPGGSVYLGLNIISEIESSSATVVAVNDGHAWSMGAVISLMADEIETSDYTSYLFHKAYYIDEATREKVFMTPKDTYYELMELIYNDKIKPLLTIEEQRVYATGEAVTFTGKEFKKRLDNL